jgi:multiple sugar transport system substrate-binding protein
VLLLGAACSREQSAPVLTISGSALGLEAELLRRQLDRFEAAHRPLRVEVRVTPDAADTRRQLYVHWLHARAPDPDVLQLDVIWTSEFAAAGWLLPLDRFGADTSDFFPAAIGANRWRGTLYALPWFVDVGMLYWRTDLMAAPPDRLEALNDMAGAAMASGATRFGLVWQGARYEGLVTVFLEHLAGFGGSILDEGGGVVVDSDAAVRALTFMRDAIWQIGIVPPAVLAWQEEQTRFAFQSGEAAFMRNWPYAYTLLQDPAASRVAGRVGVAPMPAAPGGASAAALGGSHLAISRYTDNPEAAYALIEFLTDETQMLERAEMTGQLPARPALYESEALAAVLPIDPAAARAIVNRAVARPATPIYSELSEILQVALHRVLTRQEEPRPALMAASGAIRQALERAGLDRQGTSSP